MKKQSPGRKKQSPLTTKGTRDYQAFSYKLLSYANKGISHIDFLEEILKMLLSFSGCDAVELWLKGDNSYTRCRMENRAEDSFQYEVIKQTAGLAEERLLIRDESSIIDRLRSLLICRKPDPSVTGMTQRGSFWTGDISREKLPRIRKKSKKAPEISANSCRSLALIPLVDDDKIIGLLQLESRTPNHFKAGEISSYENMVSILSIAIINQRAQADLQERVKELTCLYRIAQVADSPGLSLDGILENIVKLLPPAWKYPEIATGRIILDGYAYATSGFVLDGQRQISDIIIKGEKRGVVEVAYREPKPELDEGPFLREERTLIDNIARQVALIAEKKEAETEKLQLQEQIRHADRLATIGQLAAGVAHELNEPLGNILGFAQLMKKATDLASQTDQDLDKIVNASLHAREVIKKLMIFSRQMPAQKTRINLNKVVEDGLYFFEARCAKAEIELIRQLASDLPDIFGDQTQLNQVLVNLVVNAIQAMPDRGKLTIKTYTDNHRACLIVEDTGVGISRDIIKKIFLPFFTTKDVNEGTGLGLAVVHGIVTLHKGTIEVESKVGEGSRFMIQFPVAENQEER
jgi:two-component system NtrC family sensor kinase